MSFVFRPATTGSAPIFVMISGGTNTGKSWSSLLIARGMVGSTGKIAALDTEGGRLSSLAKHHRFDLMVMQPPFRPTLFAEAAEDAESQGYGALVIDSASMMHVGPGGYRDWHEREITRLCKGDEKKRHQYEWPARRLPSLDRQAMLYRMLQRRIPIIFSFRARELTEKQGDKVVPIGWQPVIHKEFIYDMTVGFTLRPEDGKGVIRYREPYKVERDHEAIFKDGDLITVEHGAALMDLMRRETSAPAFEVIRSDGRKLGFPSIQGWATWWDRPIEIASPDALKALMASNGPLMLSYAQDYPDVVDDIQQRLADAIQGIKRRNPPDEDSSAAHQSAEAA